MLGLPRGQIFRFLCDRVRGLSKNAEERFQQKSAQSGGRQPMRDFKARKIASQS
jgi:hypothetical protein